MARRDAEKNGQVKPAATVTWHCSCQHCPCITVMPAKGMTCGQCSRCQPPTGNWR